MRSCWRFCKKANKRQRDSDAQAGGGTRDAQRSATMKPLSILNWYRILRVQHQWTIFQALRYALWLAR